MLTIWNVNLTRPGCSFPRSRHSRGLQTSSFNGNITLPITISNHHTSRLLTRTPVLLPVMHRIRPRTLPRPSFHPRASANNNVPFRTYQKLPFGRNNQQYQRFSARSGIASFFTNWAQKPTFYRDIGVITAGGGAVYVLNLEEVPVSGRRRFNFIPAKVEEALGESTVAEIQQQYAGRFLDEDDPRSRMVKRVLERLLPFAFKEGHGLSEMNWEVHVIDSEEQNAFVVPGGKVFVFTGILPHCQDEDGIAAVLGHEIAHVVARHTAERMSQAPLILIPILASLALDVSFYSANMILRELSFLTMRTCVTNALNRAISKHASIPQTRSRG
jgi:hypothetical protein